VVIHGAARIKTFTKNGKQKDVTFYKK